MRWRCWHDWPKWEDAIAEIPAGDQVIQQRRCGKCGELRVRKVRIE